MTPVYVTAARQAQRASLRIHYTGCPHCRRALTIAETIERHCIDCELDIQPREILEKRDSAEEAA